MKHENTGPQMARWFRTAILCLAWCTLGAHSAWALTATSTALAPSVNPVVIGQPLTLSATVTPTAGTGTPSGTVTFKDGSTTLGTAPLASGVATLGTRLGLTGSHSLSAVYGADTTYAASTSATLVETVNGVSGNWGRIALENASFTVSTSQVVRYGTAAKWIQKTVNGSATCSNAFFGSDPARGITKECGVLAGTTSSTALTSSLNPTTVGQNTVLTATVTPATASGVVTFLDGAASLGTATLASGVATLTKSLASVGAHTLTAVYAGTPTYASSTSPAQTQTVTTLATSLVLSTAPTTVAAGQATVLTAKITPAAATGTVTFKDGTATLGSASLSSGTATFTVAAGFATTGAHSLTAVYAATGAYAASTSAAVTQTVTVASTTLALSATANPGVVNQALTLKATISPASASGTVTFKEGTTTLGSASLSAGVASLGQTFTGMGSHTVTASYAGTASYLASASNALALAINGPTIALPAPPASPTPVVSFAYDAQGNPTAVTQAPDSSGFAFTTSTAYDALRRPTRCPDLIASYTQIGGNHLGNKSDEIKTKSLRRELQAASR